MKVKELKEFLAKMDDEQEVNAEVPVGIIVNLEDLKRKRLYAISTFPKEGIPLTDLIDESDLQSILEEGTDGDVSETIMEKLTDWDKLYDIEQEYTKYELR